MYVSMGCIHPTPGPFHPHALSPGALAGRKGLWPRAVDKTHLPQRCTRAQGSQEARLLLLRERGRAVRIASHGTSGMCYTVTGGGGAEHFIMLNCRVGGGHIPSIQHHRATCSQPRSRWHRRRTRTRRRARFSRAPTCHRTPATPADPTGWRSRAQSAPARRTQQNQSSCHR